MARIITGTLYAPFFNEIDTDIFSFENAIYNNQTDQTGSGAYDLKTGFILYIQATDPNIGIPVVGVFNRYKLIDLTIIDSITINGTIVWDEINPRYDSPTHGSYCIIAEPTPNLKLGMMPSNSVYPELNVGADIAAVVDAERNILDVLVTNRLLNINIPAGTNQILPELTIDVLAYSGEIIEYQMKDLVSGSTRAGHLYITTDGAVASITDHYADTSTVVNDIQWDANVVSGNVEVSYTTTTDKKMHASIKKFPIFS